MRVRRLIALFAFLASVFPLAATASAQPLNFVVIQPGQPGSPQEAQPVMDAIAAYVSEKIDAPVEGVYFNELPAALEFLQNTPPQWGIVSFPVFAVHAGEFAMTPIASSRPGGEQKDRWRLLVPHRQTTDWRNLSGTIQGTVLYEPAAAACLLFGEMPQELPFALEGTRAPLQAVRAAARGQVAGVVVDRLQHEAFQALPAAGELSEIADTGEIPTSPVVWFAAMDERTGRLQEVLQAMGDDPDAADLLRLLQTDGFGAAAPELARWRFDDARCPR